MYFFAPFASYPVEASAKTGFATFAVNISGEFNDIDQEGHEGDQEND